MPHPGIPDVYSIPNNIIEFLSALRYNANGEINTKEEIGLRLYDLISSREPRELHSAPLLSHLLGTTNESRTNYRNFQGSCFAQVDIGNSFVLILQPTGLQGNFVTGTLARSEDSWARLRAQQKSAADENVHGESRLMAPVPSLCLTPSFNIECTSRILQLSLSTIQLPVRLASTEYHSVIGDRDHGEEYYFSTLIAARTLESVEIFELKASYRLPSNSLENSDNCATSVPRLHFHVARVDQLFPPHNEYVAHMSWDNAFEDEYTPSSYKIGESQESSAANGEKANVQLEDSKTPVIGHRISRFPYSSSNEHYSTTRNLHTSDRFENNLFPVHFTDARTRSHVLAGRLQSRQLVFTTHSGGVYHWKGTYFPFHEAMNQGILCQESIRKVLSKNQGSCDGSSPSAHPRPLDSTIQHEDETASSLGSHTSRTENSLHNPSECYLCSWTTSKNKNNQDIYCGNPTADPVSMPYTVSSLASPALPAFNYIANTSAAFVRDRSSTQMVTSARWIREQDLLRATRSNRTPLPRDRPPFEDDSSCSSDSNDDSQSTRSSRSLGSSISASSVSTRSSISADSVSRSASPDRSTVSSQSTRSARSLISSVPRSPSSSSTRSASTSSLSSTPSPRRSRASSMASSVASSHSMESSYIASPSNSHLSYLSNIDIEDEEDAVPMHPPLSRLEFALCTPVAFRSVYREIGGFQGIWTNRSLSRDEQRTAELTAPLPMQEDSENPAVPLQRHQRSISNTSSSGSSTLNCTPPTSPSSTSSTSCAASNSPLDTYPASELRRTLRPGLWRIFFAPVGPTTDHQEIFAESTHSECLLVNENEAFVLRFPRFDVVETIFLLETIPKVVPDEVIKGIIEPPTAEATASLKSAPLEEANSNQLSFSDSPGLEDVLANVPDFSSDGNIPTIAFMSQYYMEPTPDASPDTSPVASPQYGSRQTSSNATQSETVSNAEITSARHLRSFSLSTTSVASTLSFASCESRANEEDEDRWSEVVTYVQVHPYWLSGNKSVDAQAIQDAITAQHPTVPSDLAQESCFVEQIMDSQTLSLSSRDTASERLQDEYSEIFASPSEGNEEAVHNPLSIIPTAILLTRSGLQLSCNTVGQDAVKPDLKGDQAIVPVILHHRRKGLSHDSNICSVYPLLETLTNEEMASLIKSLSGIHETPQASASEDRLENRTIESSHVLNALKRCFIVVTRSNCMVLDISMPSTPLLSINHALPFAEQDKSKNSMDQFLQQPARHPRVPTADILSYAQYIEQMPVPTHVKQLLLSLPIQYNMPDLVSTCLELDYLRFDPSLYLDSFGTFSPDRKESTRSNENSICALFDPYICFLPWLACHQSLPTSPPSLPPSVFVTSKAVSFTCHASRALFTTAQESGTTPAYQLAFQSILSTANGPEVGTIQYTLLLGTESCSFKYTPDHDETSPNRQDDTETSQHLNNNLSAQPHVHDNSPAYSYCLLNIPSSFSLSRERYPLAKKFQSQGSVSFPGHESRAWDGKVQFPGFNSSLPHSVPHTNDTLSMFLYWIRRKNRFETKHGSQSRRQTRRESIDSSGCALSVDGSESISSDDGVESDGSSKRRRDSILSLSDGKASSKDIIDPQDDSTAETVVRRVTVLRLSAQTLSKYTLLSQENPEGLPLNVSFNGSLLYCIPPIQASDGFLSPFDTLFVYHMRSATVGGFTATLLINTQALRTHKDRKDVRVIVGHYAQDAPWDSRLASLPIATAEECEALEPAQDLLDTAKRQFLRHVFATAHTLNVPPLVRWDETTHSQCHAISSSSWKRYSRFRGAIKSRKPSLLHSRSLYSFELDRFRLVPVLRYANGCISVNATDSTMHTVHTVPSATTSIPQDCICPQNLGPVLNSADMSGLITAYLDSIEETIAILTPEHIYSSQKQALSNLVESYQELQQWPLVKRAMQYAYYLCRLSSTTGKKIATERVSKLRRSRRLAQRTSSIPAPSQRFTEVCKQIYPHISRQQISQLCSLFYHDMIKEMSEPVVGIDSHVRLLSHSMQHNEIILPSEQFSFRIDQLLGEIVAYFLIQSLPLIQKHKGSEFTGQIRENEFEDEDSELQSHCVEDNDWTFESFSPLRTPNYVFSRANSSSLSDGSQWKYSQMLQSKLLSQKVPVMCNNLVCWSYLCHIASHFSLVELSSFLIYFCIPLPLPYTVYRTVQRLAAILSPSGAQNQPTLAHSIPHCSEIRDISRSSLKRIRRLVSNDPQLNATLDAQYPQISRKRKKDINRLALSFLQSVEQKGMSMVDSISCRGLLRTNTGTVIFSEAEISDVHEWYAQTKRNLAWLSASLAPLFDAATNSQHPLRAFLADARALVESRYTLDVVAIAKLMEQQQTWKQSIEASKILSSTVASNVDRDLENYELSHPNAANTFAVAIPSGRLLAPLHQAFQSHHRSALLSQFFKAEQSEVEQSTKFMCLGESLYPRKTGSPPLRMYGLLKTVPEPLFSLLRHTHTSFFTSYINSTSIGSSAPSIGLLPANTDSRNSLSVHCDQLDAERQVSVVSHAAGAKRPLDGISLVDIASQEMVDKSRKRKRLMAVKAWKRQQLKLSSGFATNESSPTIPELVVIAPMQGSVVPENTKVKIVLETQETQSKDRTSVNASANETRLDTAIGSGATRRENRPITRTPQLDLAWLRKLPRWMRILSFVPASLSTLTNMAKSERQRIMQEKNIAGSSESLENDLGDGARSFSSNESEEGMVASPDPAAWGEKEQISYLFSEEGVAFVLFLLKKPVSLLTLTHLIRSTPISSSEKGSNSASSSASLPITDKDLMDLNKGQNLEAMGESVAQMSGYRYLNTLGHADVALFMYVLGTLQLCYVASLSPTPFLTAPLAAAPFGDTQEKQKALDTLKHYIKKSYLSAAKTSPAPTVLHRLVRFLTTPSDRRAVQNSDLAALPTIAGSAVGDAGAILPRPSIDLVSREPPQLEMPLLLDDAFLYVLGPTLHSVVPVAQNTGNSLAKRRLWEIHNKSRNAQANSIGNAHEGDEGDCVNKASRGLGGGESGESDGNGGSDTGSRVVPRSNVKNNKGKAKKSTGNMLDPLLVNPSLTFDTNPALFPTPKDFLVNAHRPWRGVECVVISHDMASLIGTYNLAQALDRSIENSPYHSHYESLLREARTRDVNIQDLTGWMHSLSDMGLLTPQHFTMRTPVPAIASWFLPYCPLTVYRAVTARKKAMHYWRARGYVYNPYDKQFRDHFITRLTRILSGVEGTLISSASAVDVAKNVPNAFSIEKARESSHPYPFPVMLSADARVPSGINNLSEPVSLYNALFDSSNEKRDMHLDASFGLTTKSKKLVGSKDLFHFYPSDAFHILAAQHKVENNTTSDGFSVQSLPYPWLTHYLPVIRTISAARQKLMKESAKKRGQEAIHAKQRDIQSLIDALIYVEAMNTKYTATETSRFHEFLVHVADSIQLPPAAHVTLGTFVTEFEAALAMCEVDNFGQGNSLNPDQQKPVSAAPDAVSGNGLGYMVDPTSSAQTECSGFAATSLERFERSTWLSAAFAAKIPDAVISSPDRSRFFSLADILPPGYRLRSSIRASDFACFLPLELYFPERPPQLRVVVPTQLDNKGSASTVAGQSQHDNGKELDKDSSRKVYLLPDWKGFVSPQLLVSDYPPTILFKSKALTGLQNVRAFFPSPANSSVDQNDSDSHSAGGLADAVTNANAKGKRGRGRDASVTRRKSKGSMHASGSDDAQKTVGTLSSNVQWILSLSDPALIVSWFAVLLPNTLQSLLTELRDRLTSFASSFLDSYAEPYSTSNKSTKLRTLPPIHTWPASDLALLAQTIQQRCASLDTLSSNATYRSQQSLEEVRTWQATCPALRYPLGYFSSPLEAIAAVVVYGNSPHAIAPPPSSNNKSTSTGTISGAKPKRQRKKTQLPEPLTKLLDCVLYAVAKRVEEFYPFVRRESVSKSWPKGAPPLPKEFYEYLEPIVEGQEKEPQKQSPEAGSPTTANDTNANTSSSGSLASCRKRSLSTLSETPEGQHNVSTNNAITSENRSSPVLPEEACDIPEPAVPMAVCPRLQCVCPAGKPSMNLLIPCDSPNCFLLPSTVYSLTPLDTMPSLLGVNATLDTAPTLSVSCAPSSTTPPSTLSALRSNTSTLFPFPWHYPRELETNQPLQSKGLLAQLVPTVFASMRGHPSINASLASWGVPFQIGYSDELSERAKLCMQDATESRRGVKHGKLLRSLEQEQSAETTHDKIKSRRDQGEEAIESDASSNASQSADEGEASPNIRNGRRNKVGQLKSRSGSRSRSDISRSSIAEAVMAGQRTDQATSKTTAARTKSKKRTSYEVQEDMENSENRGGRGCETDKPSGNATDDAYQDDTETADTGMDLLRSLLGMDTKKDKDQDQGDSIEQAEEHDSDQDTLGAYSQSEYDKNSEMSDVTSKNSKITTDRLRANKKKSPVQLPPPKVTPSSLPLYGEDVSPISIYRIEQQGLTASYLRSMAWSAHSIDTTEWNEVMKSLQYLSIRASHTRKKVEELEETSRENDPSISGMDVKSVGKQLYPVPVSLPVSRVTDSTISSLLDEWDDNMTTSHLFSH